MPNEQQGPDGVWREAPPLDWQPGLDVEVTRGPWGYWAQVFDKDAVIGSVRSRWRWLLRLKLILWFRRFAPAPPMKGPNDE